MFERFTEKARASIEMAGLEARSLGHDHLGTEHLLLGLLRSGGVAAGVLAAEGVDVLAVRNQVRRRVGATSASDAEVLRRIGIDVDEVRAAVEESFGAGALDRPVRTGRGRWRTRPVFAPAAKKVLDLALREALHLQHRYIGTEHLLLAIVRLGEGVGHDILRDEVGDPETLRCKVMEALRQVS